MAEENGLAVFSLRLPKSLSKQIDDLAKLARRNRNAQIVLMLEERIDLQVLKDRQILEEMKKTSS